ncbi:hypothetical protein [uncultured Tateyamaria sp.]|uniref:hypothetical protein n=1 Tax=uncultured Tateyamaria sp. TaxID=455651 RepID=UPI003450B4A4
MLRGRDRHELACSTCGAPLHDLKMLPKKKQAGDRDLVRPSAIQSPRQPKSARKKFQKRTSRWKDMFEDAFDIIEDIFD